MRIPLFRAIFLGKMRMTQSDQFYPTLLVAKESWKPITNWVNGVLEAKNKVNYSATKNVIGQRLWGCKGIESRITRDLFDILRLNILMTGIICSDWWLAQTSWLIWIDSLLWINQLDRLDLFDWFNDSINLNDMIDWTDLIELIDFYDFIWLVYLIFLIYLNQLVYFVYLAYLVYLTLFTRCLCV
jgi:hypothetical protein